MAKNNTVYDTKNGKYYAIHPDMAKDKVWMASHGLILQVEPSVSRVANLETNQKAALSKQPVKPSKPE
jgi:hypothetical protein